MRGGCILMLFLSVVFMIASKVYGADPLCENNDWIPNDIYCYLFNNGDNRTWYHANEECNSRQAQLLRIESAAELSFLKQKFQGFPSPEYWTALNQLKPDNTGGTGTWLWGSDEYPDNSVVVWNQEPDNSDDEDCGAISIQATFSDEKCSAKFPFICETDFTQENGCPMFWLQGQQDCFMVSNYTDPTQYLTWQQAKDACQNIQPFSGVVITHLLSFDVAGDTDFLSKNIPTWDKTTVRFWTGLNDIKTEGSWVWDVGASFNPSLIRWTKEPDNLAGREFCATVAQEGGFSDRNCYSPFNFVCRKQQVSKTDSHDFGCGSWIRAGHKCYKFNNKPRIPWAEARRNCQKYGGDLAKIATKDEVRYLSMLSEAPTLQRNMDHWIGLNDQDNEGTYVWADGSKSDPTLLNWSKAPRNNLGNQHCAGITRDGFKLDYPCTVSQLGYICEKPMDDNMQCPTGWTLNNYVCYLISADLADRETSLSICQRSQGQLFAVNDIDELQFFVATVKDYKSWPLVWWTGLNDKSITGSWVYPDSNDNWPEMDGLIPWSSEPNNFNGNEDCVTITYSGGYNDMRCDLPAGYICEKPSSGSVLMFSKWILSLLSFTSLYIIYSQH